MKKLLSGKFIAAVVGLLVFTTACSVIWANPFANIKVDSRLVTANTKFGFNLFSKIATQQGEKNIFLSPSSISMALSMAYNGANGDTQEAMAKTMELNDITLDDLNKANSDFKVYLENMLDSKINLKIANSVWAEKSLTFNQSFMDLNKKFYYADIKNLDFSSPDAASAINNWVSENTGKKIDKLIDKIDAGTIMFLLNAIYFKGEWSDKFDTSLTYDSDFNLLNGTKKTISMMSRTGKYNYYENEKFQAIRLPYGISGDVSMYIFLPASNSTLKEFNGNLNNENWTGWMESFSEKEVNIGMPRFKSEYEIVLNDTLKALGMDIAFDPDKADFTNLISGGGVFISEVKQKTFIEVNEEGSEAAAATYVGIAKTAAVKPVIMTVDRPFFCAIADNKSGTILFMGNIVEPM